MSVSARRRARKNWITKLDQKLERRPRKIGSKIGTPPGQIGSRDIGPLFGRPFGLVFGPHFGPWNGEMDHKTGAKSGSRIGALPAGCGSDPGFHNYRANDCLGQCFKFFWGPLPLSRFYARPLRRPEQVHEDSARTPKSKRKSRKRLRPFGCSQDEAP